MQKGLLAATIIILGLLSLISGGRASASPSRLTLDAEYMGFYESNIYHAYSDSILVSSMLNELRSDLRWKKRHTRAFEQKLTAYFDIDYYPGNTSRDRSVVGGAWEPEWRYNRHGRLGVDIDISRRNKDLVDDNGQVLARTLKRWEYDLQASHRYDIGNLRLDQEFAYQLYNYDERVDSLNNPLLSYDYHSWNVRLRATYEFAKKVQWRVTYDGEKRYYKERRTYTVRYGAYVGRPFKIRDLRQNTFETRLSYTFADRSKFAIGYEYTRRTDNFENFYGYSTNQYRAEIDLRLIPRHRTRVSFRYKTKNYPNYWTSRIGRLHRVSIDYADFQFEHEYEVSRKTSLVGYLRNYNKISNDIAFDYADVTGGVGVRFKL